MWQSLYLYCASPIEPARIASTLQTTLVGAGYEIYDPFGLVPGKAYSHQNRLFIAPPAANWTRILGDPGEYLLPALSDIGLCLLCELKGNDAQIMTWLNGEPIDPHTALTTHRSPDCTEDSLRHALSGSFDMQVVEKKDDAVPVDILPDDVRQMAQNLNPKQINKMFGKWMKRVGKRLSFDEDAARDLLAGDSADWKTPGGAQIRALMNCLTIPDDYWREPDFVTLRDAYQLHRRRQQHPNASLYPGDEESMQAVPNALEYVPVYAGKAG